MNDVVIQDALKEIESTPDLLERGLKLAGLVSAVFSEQGFELVVVGGAAIEFYTEGNYMSGDLDLCRKEDGRFRPEYNRH